MNKRKPTFKIRTFGIYTQWDKGSRKLPKILEITTTVPATIDIEFGLVVNIVGAKNRELDYCIDHPGIRDSAGKVRAPFDGTVYVKSNDWDFYLGDTIWEPVEDKLGEWKMSLELDGQVIAAKTFEVIRETPGE